MLRELARIFQMLVGKSFWRGAANASTAMERAAMEMVIDKALGHLGADAIPQHPGAATAKRINTKQQHRSSGDKPLHLVSLQVYA